MFNLTPEEKRVAWFVFSLALGGLALSQLAKINCRVAGIIYPRIQLAKLNLNRISLEELIATKCLPVKLAQQIIQERNLRKEFSNLEELKEVKGIGPQRLNKLKEIFFLE